jgi:hypothetical protein
MALIPLLVVPVRVYSTPVSVLSENKGQIPDFLVGEIFYAQSVEGDKLFPSTGPHHGVGRWRLIFRHHAFCFVIVAPGL